MLRRFVELLGAQLINQYSNDEGRELSFDGLGFRWMCCGVHTFEFIRGVCTYPDGEVHPVGVREFRFTTYSSVMLGMSTVRYVGLEKVQEEGNLSTFVAVGVVARFNDEEAKMPTSEEMIEALIGSKAWPDVLATIRKVLDSEV